jgi:predicted XRE-type DNA-binding protein
MSIEHETVGSIFDDLAITSAEAESLKIRAELMNAIKQYIKKHRLTQAQAAQQLKIDQARVSKLMSGHIELFSIDRLVKMLVTIGLHVEFNIAA